MPNEMRDDLREYTPEETAIASARAGKGMMIVVLGFLGVFALVYLALTRL